MLLLINMEYFLFICFFFFHSVELYACYSLTYIPSDTNEKCKGVDLPTKCRDPGKNGVAKISDANTLKEVQKAIEDNNEYWTRLR